MKSYMQDGLGLHLMVDCFGCSREKLGDKAFISGVLNDFPDRIKMTKVSSPYVFEYRSEAPEDDGVTGVVLIAESHITVHTFPDSEHVFVDIFSSREFDTDLACAELMKHFGAASHQAALFSRGLPAQ